MTLRSKVAPDAIERAHRALEALPQHQPDELTKAQAVKKLLGAIRATRSKGYSLAAIGKMLSECGIPITTGALRAYLSEASEAGGKKRRRRPRRGADATEGGPTEAPKHCAEAGASHPAESSTKLSGAALPGNADLDWDAGARSDKAASRASQGLDSQAPTEDV